MKIDHQLVKNQPMIPRHLTPLLRAALSDSPALFLAGPRQAGKSTLAQSLGDPVERPYRTFDDATVLAAVKEDPTGFVANFPEAVILDEVQRAPELFPALKLAIDRDRRPGRFLLTGSADVFLIPALSESLVGRVELLTLWPLSQGEIERAREGFIDALFSGEPWAPPASLPLPRTELLDRVVRGGFPEALTRASQERRRVWFDSYVATLLQRDIRDLAQIEGVTAMPRLLSLLATRSASLLNFSELARSSGLALSTLKRYVSLLVATFVIQELPAWSANLGKRLVKSPKVFLSDTGLACALLALSRERLEREPALFGPLLETFVAQEVRRQIGWSRTRPALFHYRTQTGQEIDLLLEDGTGRVAGIEIKASSTLQSRDVRALRDLEETLGDRFLRGVIFYGGETAVPFSPKVWALPLPLLWRWPSYHAD